MHVCSFLCVSNPRFFDLPTPLRFVVSSSSYPWQAFPSARTSSAFRPSAASSRLSPSSCLLCVCVCVCVCVYVCVCVRFGSSDENRQTNTQLLFLVFQQLI